MGRKLIAAVAALGTAGSFASFSFAAPISVTVDSYTPGTISPGTLDTAAYKATTDTKIQDFPRNTGGGTNKFARGLSNNSFAATTIIPVGKGGGITLKFQQPIQPLAGAKEFGVFNGNFLSTSGGFFYGDMEGAVLVSRDNVEWRTLAGDVVADPLTYATTTYNMNAPTMSYVWGTGKVAWDYPTGSGKPQSVLDTFALSDFETPMPDDALYNGLAGTDAQRNALRTSTVPADYANLFGTTAGGNWFDISSTGLSEVQYLRINVATNAPSTMRLDSVFANTMAAVPEPVGVGVLALGGLLLVRRRVRISKVVLGVACASLLVGADAAQAVTFDDVDYWVGSGSNQAGFVVDWNDGKTEESLVWGFRWDGAATGETMLKAIVNADPRLFAHVSTPGSFGVALYGVGYDLDDDGAFGLSNAAGLTFDANGLAVNNGFFETATPTDAADHWQEGWFSAGFWSYYLGGNSATPSWSFSGVGMSTRTLTNGAWDGWSFAPGFSGSTPSEPVAAAVAVPEPATLGVLGLGAIALLRRRRRQVVAAAALGTLAAVPAAQADYVYDPNDFAVEVVSSSNLPADSLYGDPAAVLGRPTTRHNGNLDFPPGLRRTKIVEAAYNVDAGGNRVITSFDGDTQVTVRMGRPVTDDPNNPFGIDLLVFGNAFYTATSGGFMDDSSDMNTTTISTFTFSEPVRVSVSPDNVNWYTYTAGPFGDDVFPTNGFLWDRAGVKWTDTVTDPTKPVDPSIASTLDGMTVADVLDLYDGSAGGTGFDLAASGFNSIQYVRFEGIDMGEWDVIGEIDAVADVHAVPEPGAAVALLGLAALVRRRRR